MKKGAEVEFTGYVKKFKGLAGDNMAALIRGLKRDSVRRGMVSQRRV